MTIKEPLKPNTNFSFDDGFGSHAGTETSSHEHSGFEHSQTLSHVVESYGSKPARWRKIVKSCVLLASAVGAFLVAQNLNGYVQNDLKQEFKALNIEAHLALRRYPELLEKWSDIAGNPLSSTENSAKLSPQQVAFLVQMAGFPPEAASTMACISFKESSHRTKILNKNRNGTQDTGLFQINDVWLKTCGVNRTALLNPEINAKCAFEVWKTSGFTAWEGFKRNRKKCSNYQIPASEVASN